MILALTHGAGSHSNSPLLLRAHQQLASAGVGVERFDLPFRRERSTGPPRRGDAERDRAGIRDFILDLRRRHPREPIVAGGHSYGGRQTSMLAAESPELFDGLLLLSYPLHPPRDRARLRTEHFPDLRTPALFIHGTRDPFGLPEEMELALAAIPARKQLTLVDGAGHELLKPRSPEIPGLTEAFTAFFLREKME